MIKSITLLLSFTCAILVPRSVDGPLIYRQADDQDQATATVASTKTLPPASGPRFTEYRGVRIGMEADEARKKLGNPKEKTQTQDVFIFSNNESAQIFYDEQQEIYAISIDFRSKNNAPAPTDILGEDITAKTDGSMYQMRQYPDAGFWVSYNRTAGNSPLITVTIQRMPGSKQ